MIINALLYYLSVVPILVYSFINVSYLINKVKIQKQYNSIDSEQIIVNNPATLSNLSHIDIAIFGKTGTITDPYEKREVEGIIIKSTYFSLNRE